MKRYSLVLIAALNWTACFGQDTVYCLPKAYADSIAYDLQKYDQLKIVYEAQTDELEQAYILLDLYHAENLELDSLNSENVAYYEEENKQQRRTIAGLVLVVLVETLLLLLK